MNVNQVNPETNQLPSEELIIVGLGASAGGVEALEELFKLIPPDLGIAYVIIQHLSAEFESLMPQILDRKTEMPVYPIVDGQTVEPNTVYVLPSGTDAVIQNRVLRTHEFTKRRMYYPIDAFFESLANDAGQNAIGIILSGTGSDGATGVVQLNNVDGISIVQNEASAKFNGMPRAAIETGAVDAVVSLDEIPEMLKRITGLEPKPNEPRKKLLSKVLNSEHAIIQILQHNYRIDFDQYRTEMVSRRISRRMMLTGFANPIDYVQFLKSDPEELEKLYYDLLIGVTEFFRDPQLFDDLQHHVLPFLLENAKASGVFRLWVVPCATGEEAFSLAILIDEIVQQRKMKIDVKIFATDVNPRCVEQASRGIFSKERLSQVSNERLKRYFKKTEENEYQIDNQIRSQIVFATHDILLDAPFTKLNLVSCRNLLIYFKKSAKKKVLSLLNFSLKSQGVLFVGPSESVEDLKSAFEPIEEVANLFRKKIPVRYSEFNLAVDDPSRALPLIRKRPVGFPQQVTVSNELSAAYESLLTTFIPPGFLIDEKDNILHVFGNGSEFLQLGEGRPTNNLLAMLTPWLKSPVSSALKRARVEPKPITCPETIVGPNEQKLALEVRNVKTDFATKFLITLNDVGHQEQENQLVPSVDLSSHEMIRELQVELEQTRDNLHDSILNLKSTNEEVQSTNEELTAANEELQSTNEELHSVNEELYTVNSEHQRKISELTELTDDMNNLLDSIQVDTIFLDRNLCVRKFTLGIAKTFSFLPQDVGRSFQTFNHNLKNYQPLRLYQ